MASPRLGSLKILLLSTCALGVRPAVALQPPGDPSIAVDVSPFRRENLVAWCIVPFDARKRSPEERAAMLNRLGFRHFAYDYRAEHVPTFEAEIEACRKHGVELSAWWFPGSLNAEARHILDVSRRHDLRPQLWVSGGGAPVAAADAEQQRARVEQEAARIRPIAEAAAAQGMKVGLYNHGGWFGEPENQLAVVERLKLPNVGIVYNLHHGHDHVDRLAEILRRTLPHLLAVNLNGMSRNGDRRGRKILQLGQGELDLQLLKIIRDSGYRGPIGILGHTQDDAEARLQDNLDGLDWLLPQLDGKPPGPKPKPRTPVPTAHDPAAGAAATPAARAGYLADGRREYTATPLTIELRATLGGKQAYNILAACETKASPRHWELFTMPGSGVLTAYLPGRKPDHVRTTVDLCDGRPRDVAMIYEADRVRLFADGRLAADATIETPTAVREDAPPQGLAVGRLVEGTLGCDGAIDELWIARGAHRPHTPEKHGYLVGQWIFGPADVSQVADLSPLKNPLRRTTKTVAPPSKSPTPAPGVHLKPVDPELQVALIDRSADDVYMGVKVDDRGQVFVGGREGVFVFEPRPDGGFTPRRELLRFPRDSIIMGLEFRGDDLLVLTANALYEVPQGRLGRANLRPRRVLWGLPLDLHVSFHCLAWGGDGKLYLTHGDPLLGYGDWQRPDHWGHWTLFSRPLSADSASAGAPEPRSDDASVWRRTPFTGQGAVLRMDVGSGELEVVAAGLRGPVGLAFDDRGNMFTNDNDHESRADQYAPARLLHVVEGIDFAWPRGWTASKSTDRRDLVEPMCDLGRGVPCDLLYCRGPLPAASFAGRLLLCRWDRRAVTAYRPTPRGVSFSAVEETVLTGDDDCRPVGIAQGPDGRLFVTSVYMTGNMAAPYCASDLVVVAPKRGGPVAADGAGRSAAVAIEPQRSPSSWTLDDARSDDTYRRQLGTSRLAQTAAPDQLRELSRSDDLTARLAAVSAAGRRLTIPSPSSVPPAAVELFYPQESSFFKRRQSFYGGEPPIDLATLGRIGSFTTAQRWAKTKHSADEEQLFDLLVAALDDSADEVRLQAAHELSLLNDPRSEPRVVAARRDVQLRRLAAAPIARVAEAWVVGPLSGGGSGATSASQPDPQRLDLSESYEGRTWQRSVLADASTSHRPAPAGEPPTSARDAWFLHFRASSGLRQDGLLTVAAAAGPQVWVNGREAKPLDVATSRVAASEYLVELQPGSNDFVVRMERRAPSGPPATAIELRAGTKLDVALPEKLDSSLLAARLREAAASGSTTAVDPAFLAVDWTRAAAEGDPAAGRRLFGTLACAKCHAVAPDQKSAGAPSLFEARRRFAVPHLVESILLPSRLVAEPFRGQTITTTDGRTVTGLVTSETAETLELLLPDATRRSLAKPTIEERTPSPISPMPQGLVKTPAELRNLLAYLLGDRVLPP